MADRINGLTDISDYSILQSTLQQLPHEPLDTQCEPQDRLSDNGACTRGPMWGLPLPDSTTIWQIDEELCYNAGV